MIFSLAVYGAPADSRGANTALRFARGLQQKGHELYRVFFYNQGVYNANKLVCPPQDEPDIPSDWQQFAEEHSVELIVCIASSMRRGVIDTTESQRNELDDSNLRKGFELSGLGQLVDAIQHSDRFMTFGA